MATAQEDGDRPETGLQGQVPLIDQLSGRSQLGYREGLRLVGQNDIMDRGSNFQLAWAGDCAYVGPIQVGTATALELVDEEILELNGVAVVDASDPADPQLVRILQRPESPASTNAWEALEANEARGVLAVSGVGNSLDLFDISEDCRDPVRKANFDLPLHSHGMRLSDDGMTAYVSRCCDEDVDEPDLAIVDLSDLAQPQLITTWSRDGDGSGVHDLDLSPDGTRAYLTASHTPENGLYIVDVSEVQARHDDPEIRVVSRLFWAPPRLWLPVSILGIVSVALGGSHTLLHTRIGDRTYLISQDEWPIYPGCPWADGRIIDITDETRPLIVSEVSLEVNDPDNCTETSTDGTIYSTHYVNVDDPTDATTAFFSWYSSGLRAFDISDPSNPQEIAYYNPPAKPDTLYRGYFNTLTWDATTSDIRYRPETGHIWFVSVANGLQIVEFTPTCCP